MPLNVLVALDGSDKDERAVSVAAALLELTEGRARVVRVLSPEERAPAIGIQEAAARLDTRTRFETGWEVLNGRDVAAALLHDIESNRADFVVAATRAAGPVGRVVRGSVADRLVRESTCPVVLVPPRASHLAGKEVQWRRVLVPIDGSLAALSVLSCLLSFPGAHNLDVILLQAVHANPAGAETAEERLRGVAEYLRIRGVTARVRVVDAPNAGAVLIDTASDDLVDFIAMTTRGAGGLQRLVLGSVAEYVVQHSGVPVLLVTGRSSVTEVKSTIGAWR